MRFIINLPSEELQEAERICFQIEEAQWFYEDFIRPLDPENLPTLNLRNFYMLISQHCPMLRDFPAELHEEAFQRFLAYKTRVPVRGAILLNERMDEVVLVKGWKKGANWSFPRGKINKEESDLHCAIREVYEETGLDLKTAGLVADGENTKSIEVVMREQQMKLFVFRNVPMDFPFEPQTRKEISKIQWYKLSELPTVKKNKHQQEGKDANLAVNANKFYMVAPFLGPLKKWIGQQRRMDKSRSISQPVSHPAIGDVDNGVESEDQPAGNGTGDEGQLGSIMHLLRATHHQNLPERLDDLEEILGKASTQTNADNHILRKSSTVVQQPKSPHKDDLLALLRGPSAKTPEVPPETPAAQVINEPEMPHSPPHHHLSRMPTLPTNSGSFFPQLKDLRDQHVSTEVPQERPAPSLVQPERLVPQIQPQTHVQALGNVPHLAAPAPYQRTEDPLRFTQDASISQAEFSTIPQASHLPPPKINPNSAKLLSLFKTGKAAESSGIQTQGPMPSTGVDSVPARPTTLFVPSQVSPKPVSESEAPPRPLSGREASLLSLFKSPPMLPPQPEQVQAAFLQPPSAPVELSAQATPGHSREPSQVRQSPPQVSSTRLTSHNVTIKKRSHQDLSPRVSATINGPLNIPQFDAIAKQSRPVKHATSGKSVKPENPTQITILARPGSSHSNIASETPVRSIAASENKESSSPRPKTFQDTKQPHAIVTPTKIPQPPTPNLKAQIVPPKPFQPQILRRPGRQGTDSEEPSPIQPLPSPSHNPTKRKLNQHLHGGKPSNDEQRKSLLSLFTSSASSAPVVSPASATPIGGEGSLLAALTSPSANEITVLPSLENPASTKPQVSSQQYEPKQAPIMPPSSENKKIKAPPEPILINSSLPNVATQVTNREMKNGESSSSIAVIAANGNQKASTSASQDPAGAVTGGGGIGGSGGLSSGKKTPSETRDVLLGFLKNVRA